jgi:branched-subunit amino acid ABC-type transport system permease component
LAAFISYILSGIQLGILYGIVTIGFNLLILVTGVLNFSYSHLLVLSMYAGWLILEATNNIWVAAGGSFVTGVILNAVLTPLFLPFIKKRAHLESLVISIGIALISVEIMSHWLNAGLPIAFSKTIQMSDSAIKFGLASIGMGRIISLIAGIILLFVFFRVLYHSKQGRILRAVAQDTETAAMMGISIPKTMLVSFALGGLLAGVVAILMAVSLGSASAELGDNITLMCLAILFLAGIGNLKGGLICAVFMGIVEGLVMGYLPPDWTKAFAFSVILVVLLFKHRGPIRLTALEVKRVTLFQFYFFEFSAIYIMIGWAVYLMFRINQPYFGSLYSMCIGAYFAAYTSINFGWPVWLILIGAVILSALIALIPAFRLAKLGPFPMVIASIALLFIIQTIVKNTDVLGARYGLFGMPFIPQHITLMITYGLLILIGYVVFHLNYSHIGRAMDAIHFDRDVAETLGINTNSLSVQFQIISSAIGAIAGVLYAYTMQGVFPAAFNMNLMMYAITIVVLGGMHTMWGVIISAPFLWGISQFLPKNLTGLSIIIYGVLLILMLLVRPGGIIDRKTIKRFTRG